jgi:hypothetical protein
VGVGHYTMATYGGTYLEADLGGVERESNHVSPAGGQASTDELDS